MQVELISSEINTHEAGLSLARSRIALTRDLESAARLKYPVQITRGWEGWVDWLDAYVVGVGEKWVVLQSLAQAVYFDGYYIIRLADIKDVDDNRENGYIERAVAGLGGRPRADFRLSAQADIKDVLTAVSARSKLFSVHLEAEPDNPRLVGQLIRLGERKFDLQLIDAKGAWIVEPTRWWYHAVTCVSFGGRYETALERFGEERPIWPPLPS